MNKIDRIFKYCDSKNNGIYFDRINEYCKKNVSKMSIENKKQFLNDFITQLETELNKNITENLSSKFKKISLGAMLAICLVHPSYAKTMAENILTHHPITAKYESGDKGYDCIVKDNYGGYSYGKDQISTERRNGKPSTFDYFMKYAKEKDPNIEYHLRKAGGWEAAHKGNKEFKDKWCEMTYRKDFRDVYDGFMRDNEFIPVYNRMDNASHGKFDKITTWASKNKAVQAAINSTIIQHGKNGAYKIFDKIVANNNIQTPEQFVKALYDLRATKYPKYKNRYKNEYKDISNYLQSKISML